MKRIIPLLALVGSLFLALLVFGGGFAAGQQNPAITPTPTPTPVAPNWWPKGLPFSEDLLKNGLDRVAPVAPSAPFTITVKTDGTGKCEVKVEGHEYVPDYALSLEAMKNCNALSSKSIVARKEVELEKLRPAPIPASVKTDPFGGCIATGDADLARGCFDLSRDGMKNLHPALPDPFPPAVELPEKFGWASTAENGTKYTAYGYNNVEPWQGAVITFERDNGIRVDTKNVYVNYKISTYAFGIQTWGLDQLMLNYTDKQTGQTKSEIWSISELFPKF